MNFIIPLGLVAAGGLAMYAVRAKQSAADASLDVDLSDALSGVELGRDGGGVPDDLWIDGGYSGAFTTANTFSTEAGASNDFDWIDALLGAFLGENPADIFGGAGTAAPLVDNRPYNTGGKPQPPRVAVNYPSNSVADGGGGGVSGGAVPAHDWQVNPYRPRTVN